jgi:hypothetical protein
MAMTTSNSTKVNPRLLLYPITEITLLIPFQLVLFSVAKQHVSENRPIQAARTPPIVPKKKRRTA